jgi:ABC-type tungstate transport system substrate-binding protein
MDGLREAVAALLTARGEVLGIVGLSLLVSGAALFLATLLGVPLGILLGLHRFPGRSLVITLVNTCMGLPPVVVGLVVFLLLARSGPLGGLELLYTPTAMVVAQVVIATPLVAGVSLAALQGLDQRLHVQILSLGASRVQLYAKLIAEARLSLLAALAAGFGAVISEVGAVMMVGGNIRGETRVMTTSIVLETRQGHFAQAAVLGVVLLFLTLLVNWALTALQQRRPA